MALMDVAVNETRILQTLWKNPGMSRIRVADELGINKSTVTKIVSTLLEEEILVLAEKPDILETKGRRPTGLFINPALGVVIGIELQTGSWTSVALDLSGAQVDRFEGSFEPVGTPAEQVLLDVVEQSLERSRNKGQRCLGIGVGLSGQVDPYRGIILQSNPLNIREPLEFADLASLRFALPVMVENDANCCCWEVFLDKKSRRERNFLCLLAEFRRTGVGPEDGYSELEGIALGMGVVIKDSVLHGDDFSAGEFQSLFRQVENSSQFNITNLQLKNLKQDSSVREILFRELAVNVSLLVNVLNMKMVKIFGNHREDPENLKRLFHQAIQENWPYDSPVECAVEVSSKGQDAVAAGAAGYFLHNLFSLPDIWEEKKALHPSGVALLRRSLGQ